MVLVITQETFDSAVRENIEDLGLEPPDAVREAVVQFETQGVDLSNIIKELMISSTDNETINNTVSKLIEFNKSKAASEEILEQLEVIKIECDKGLQDRVAAGKAGAYDALLNTLLNFKGNANVEKSCLRALIALMKKQPDLLDNRGVEIIISNLKRETEYDVKRLSLKWARECCVMHEMNRQKIFDAHILENLKELMNDPNSDILKEVWGVCRALVLDDDIRVEFGKAHEHARIIASEIMCSLTGFLSRYKDDESVINDLLVTISSLLVRTEFCKKVDDAGGLEHIGDVMNCFSSNEKISRQAFKLLKALAGNDECKDHIIKSNLAPVITAALSNNEENVPTVIAGLACVSAITLRSSDNSKAFFEAGLPAVIVEIMRKHPEEQKVQKTASWAIRNMVSRSRYQNATFLKLGVEQVLHDDLKKFKAIEYDLKAALRDLDCKVNFKEEWTGKGGALTTGRTCAHRED